MALRLHHIVLDARDLPGLARFWAQELGSRILSEGEWEVSIGPDDAAPLGMRFMPVTDAKTIRTVCNSTSQPLLRIGTPRSSASLLSARTEDIGQTGDESWTVLADSEGNEFCVVRPWTTLVV